MKIAVVAWFGMVAVIAFPAHAAPGARDAAFGTLGIAPSPVPDSGYCAPCAPPGGVVVQSTGRIVTASASTADAVVGYSAGGSVDASHFGTNGVAALPSAGPTYGSVRSRALAVLPDDTFLLLGDAIGSLENTVVLARYTASGQADTSFGAQGVALFPSVTGMYVWGDALAVQPDAKIVVVGGTQAAVRPRGTVPLLLRFEANGTRDTSFGNGGSVVDTVVPGLHEAAADVAIQRGGKVVTAGAVREGEGREAFSIRRYAADGSADLSFGANGRVRTAFTGMFGVASDARATSIEIVSGKIVVAGTVTEHISLQPDVSRVHLVVARFLDDGALDPEFGQGGWIARQLTGYFVPAPALRATLVVQPDGRLLVGTTTLASGEQRDDPDAYDFAVMRFEANGDTDATYGSGGATVVSGAGNLSALTLQDDGKALAAGSLAHAALVRLEADAHLYAVEFHHGEFDHYFATASVSEVGRLDHEVTPGWTRTGSGFRVLRLGHASDVCRFFSGQRFAPRSSHFYSSLRSECDSLRSSADWSFEGDVFAWFGVPAGNCAAGSVPLYRLYNGGRGGAPNHRFHTDGAERALMIAQGWIAEGSGTGVVGCVPAQAN